MCGKWPVWYLLENAVRGIPCFQRVMSSPAVKIPTDEQESKTSEGPVGNFPQVLPLLLNCRHVVHKPKVIARKGSKIENIESVRGRNVEI